MHEAKLDEIRKAWKNENDDYLLKAFNEDLSEYSEEVQEIIKDEVDCRGIENSHYEVYSAKKDFSDTISETICLSSILDGYKPKKPNQPNGKIRK